MRQAISKLLGLKTPQAPEKPAPAPALPMKSERAESLDNPHTIEDNSDNATRRQLVQMMLRDGLRKHGIPPGWVECRMLVVNSRSRGTGLYVRLVMRHWDMLLLTYAHAFQQQLLAAITEFEPQASDWLHGVSWELDVGNTCPYLDMPEPSVWLEVSAPVQTATVMPEVFLMPEDAITRVAVPIASSKSAPPAPGHDAEVLQDLQRMFAIRDAHLQQPVDGTPAPDFQNTEPSSRRV
ncbi:MAG: hypothetical protein Q8O29_16745 [Polaromonas sp.]|uniref:hypothetical protein n=1 Tax=Polaromonas sp. TaxID=1869339 RepID=UPI002733667F|nr:hypothetical protein [Polaromonas sp.]MDP2819884.1 hypothetical protein [Polaromonas sp.]